MCREGDASGAGTGSTLGTTPGTRAITTSTTAKTTTSTGAEATTTKLSISKVEARERAHYPLALRVAPLSRVLLRIGFDPARVSPGLARQMLAHYRAVLASFIAAPTGRLSDIDLLSALEQQRIAAWSEATATDSFR